MMKFIYICMGVVALSVLSIMTQDMTTGIMNAQNDIAARNVIPSEATVVAVESNTDSGDIASQLNAIETTAGDTIAADTGFGESFTNETPKALQEPVAVMPAPAMTDPAGGAPY